MTLRTPSALFLLVPAVIGAQSPKLSKLPDWARVAVEASRSTQTPTDAEAWVLLDRTEIAYTGGGEIRKHRYRVVQVLGERGVDEATYYVQGSGASATKVKKLKGWNLRPDGDLEKLDSDDVVTVAGQIGYDGSVSTGMFTAGRVPRAVKGSLLAFESMEVLHEPLGAIEMVSLLEPIPVLRWECVAAKQGGWFSDLKQVALKMDLLHFDGWGLQVRSSEGSVSVSDIPALPKAEAYRPDNSDLLPGVSFRFLDPAFTAAPDWSSWDGLAAFTAHSFGSQGDAPLPVLSGANASSKLEALAQWMYTSFSYHQVYLRPDRGWVPEKPEETGRKRYGDCKDFSAFLLSGVKQIGLDGVPVLARIAEGTVDPSLPPGPWFNHVISAIKLDKSLGLSSEVQTEAGRFLLVDPTDHYTPVGHLGIQHRGRWVMLCLPGKAVWVRVPDAAVLASAVSLGLKGALDKKGQLQGTLRIEETGNAWRLRQVAVESTTKDFLKWIRSGPLALPTAASCEVLSQSGARDLDKPFVVELKVSVPEALTFDGSEADLDLPGMPAVPSRITRSGEPRRFPLEWEGGKHLLYAASLDLPFPVTPVQPAMASITCCHAYTWKAVLSANHAELKLDERTTDASYGFMDLKDGVKAFNEDRAAVLRLHQDGLAFKAVR